MLNFYFLSPLKRTVAINVSPACFACLRRQAKRVARFSGLENLYYSPAVYGWATQELYFGIYGWAGMADKFAAVVVHGWAEKQALFSHLFTHYK